MGSIVLRYPQPAYERVSIGTTILVYHNVATVSWKCCDPCVNDAIAIPSLGTAPVSGHVFIFLDSHWDFKSCQRYRCGSECDYRIRGWVPYSRKTYRQCVLEVLWLYELCTGLGHDW